MKKFLVLAGLALVALGVSVQTAEAAQVFASARTVPLKFRNHAAAYGPGVAGVTGVDAMGGYIDSTKASGIAKFDTTVTISTEGWVPQLYTSSAVDSAVVCKLMIFDAGDLATVTLGKTSATAESIYVKVQVSANNIGWHDCAIIPGQAPVLNAFTVQTTVNAAVLTFTSSTNTGQSDKLWSVNFGSATGTANSAALKSGQDINHFWHFPYVRFIIMGTRATTNHNLAASLRFYSAVDQN